MSEKSETLELIIKAKNMATQEIAKAKKDVNQLTKNIATGYKKGRLAVKAFNETSKRSGKAISNLKSQVGQLIGVFAGWKAITGATAIIKDADQALFNMTASVEAANREFGKIGHLEEWESAIGNLSKELVIYSDIALRNAVSRTVDMTKRLGLSKIQMEEVIKRSADLGAGKVALEGAIERVTAALRGEAESAEFLGLTLNENYIKAWYEAQGATQGAWESLTDMQKAQVRYLVLLEQSNEMQGRAAESANTFGGALQLIRKEIENAITQNKDVKQAMSELAISLRDNAGDIGKAVVFLVKLGGKIVEFAVKYKTLIAYIVSSAFAVAVINKITLAIKGLNAALIVLTGQSIIQGLAGFRSALNAIAMSAGLASVALKGAVAAAAALGAIKIGQLGKEIWGLNKDLKENREEAARAHVSAQQFKAAADVQILSKKELLKLSEEERQAYRKSLGAALQYYSHLEYEANLLSTDAMLGGLLPFQSAKGRENERKAKDLAKVTREYASALREASKDVKISDLDALTNFVTTYEKVAEMAYKSIKKGEAEGLAAIESGVARGIIAKEKGELQKLAILAEYAAKEAALRKTTADRIEAIVGKEAEVYKKVADIAKEAAKKSTDAHIKALNAFEKATRDAYTKAKKEVEDYAQKVKDAQREVLNVHAETEDMVREIRQRGMSDEQRQADLEIQAAEKLKAARKALADGDKDRAKRLAEQSRSIASGLEDEEEAINGVKEAGKLLETIAEESVGAWNEKLEEAKEKVADLGKTLDDIAVTRDAIVKPEIDSASLTKVEKTMKDLVRDETKTIYVETKEKKRAGGSVGMARGGRLPGWGGGDKVSALLEAGEFVIRKEATKKYGALLNHINNMRLPVSTTPRFTYATGGIVPSMDMKYMGRIDLVGIGDKAYPLMGQIDVIGELKEAIKREKLMRTD